MVRLPRLASRVALLIVSLAICVLAAEFLYRQFGPSPSHGTLYYADADHHRVDFATADGMARAAAVLEVVPDAPRFRQRFRANTLVHFCYEGYEGRDGFDAQGCVAMRHNSWGVRDREELCTPKPAGQRRVVCLGDSTTVGWGVPETASWTRLSEDRLRERDDGIRMVNCGAAGTLVPDEYAHALTTRFAAFEPDLVLVTLCVNDLLPVNGGMAHFDPDALAALGRPIPSPWRWSRMLSDLVKLSRQTDALRLDPDHDWVGDLLALPHADYPPDARAMGEIYWSSGNPQTALRGMRAWCEARDIRFGVAIWPFLQQLDSRVEHPFTPMHERVADFCREHDIPFLDLLDVFVGATASELWVTPHDRHGNRRAHEMAAPAVADFVERLLGP